MIGMALLPLSLDNGLGMTPPLGWRSYNAFGGTPTQAVMEKIMGAMVDRSRLVDGKPTSLLDLGYKHVGLDGGWNHCFEQNHSFHLEDGTPVWNDAFPNPTAMVDKAHQLGLLPGWYLNNCGCAENSFDSEKAIETMMRGSVKMLVDMGWDGVKFDSCSQFHNLTHWAELINATGRPVLIENCHQGAYTPGMRQWQGFVKNRTSGRYDHFKGLFFGMASATPLPNVSFSACEAACDTHGDCGGFTFEGEYPAPAPSQLLRACYLKDKPVRNPMDMSNVNHCTGAATPSDCPFHMFRVSGDIRPSWSSVLANLAYTLPFLGEGGVHAPYPQDATVRSRPGGWAYPDMLEVGNLANATEDRSHFGAWAILSSPLILSFDLTEAERMDRTWPIISNRRVLSVNQRWAGDTGRRVAFVADSWQAWAKRMGKQEANSSSFAIFLMNTGAQTVLASLPLQNVSSAYAKRTAVCLRDLYTGEVQLLPSGGGSGATLEVILAAHDSGMYCAWQSWQGQGRASASCDDDSVASECP